jgi:hypothetical protein
VVLSAHCECYENLLPTIREKVLLQEDRPLTTAILDGIRVGLRMSLRLVLVLVPAGFLVFLLQLFNLLEPFAAMLDPLMGLAGLPGEAALVFVTGALVTTYPAIGVIASISFTMDEITVMALMILICHSLFVETAIQVRVGSNPVRIVLVRVLTALAVALVLGRILGLEADGARPPAAASGPGFPGWSYAGTEFLGWLHATGRTVLRVVMMVMLVMVIQRLLERSGVLPRLTRLCEPIVVVFGLPRNTAFLWLVGNTLGLTLGSAVILEEREKGDLTDEETDLLNHHLAVSHSLLEDTLLFVALGVGVIILIVPRLVAALVVVWMRRLGLRFRSSRKMLHEKK